MCAMQLLEALTQDHPTYETGFVALGDLCAARGLADSARKSFDEALRLIDRKLTRANEKLDGKTITTIAEYGKILTEVSLLTKQKGIVIEQLEQLP